jgi:hypothetical protein
LYLLPVQFLKSVSEFGQRLTGRDKIQSICREAIRLYEGASQFGIKLRVLIGITEI